MFDTSRHRHTLAILNVVLDALYDDRYTTMFLDALSNDPQIDVYIDKRFVRLVIVYINIRYDSYRHTNVDKRYIYTVHINVSVLLET